MLNLLLFLDPAAAIQSAGDVAETAQNATSNGTGFGFNIILIVALIAIFYFLMIRPQQKRQKEIQKFRESIKVGDKVITAGGIYGTIDAVKETYFIINIGDNVKIRIDKGSVYQSPEDVQQQSK